MNVNHLPAFPLLLLAQIGGVGLASADAGIRFSNDIQPLFAEK